MHGGAAPQAIRKAQERLALAADDAVSVLLRLMADETVSASDRRQIATAILDRAGISTKTQLEIAVQKAPWEVALEGMVAEDGAAGAAVARVHDYGERAPAAATPGDHPGPPDDVVDAELVDD